MTISESIKWLWSHTKSSRWQVGLNSLIGILYVTLSMLFVWCSKVIIDSATGGDGDSIRRTFYIFVAIVISQIILSMVNMRLRNYTNVSMSNSLRRMLFESVMKSRWQGKELFHTGDIMNRIERDVTTLADVVCLTIPEIITTSAQVALSFWLLHMFDPKLAWIILVIMPIALLMSKRYFVVMRKLTHRIRTKNSELQAYTQEKIQHRSLNIVMGNIDESTKRLTTMQGELLDEEMNRTNYSVFSNTVVRIGFMTSYVIAFWWGAKGLADKSISYGVMAAFMQLVSQIQTPTISLSKHISTLAQSLTSIDRLVQLTSLEHEAEGDAIVMGRSVGVRVSGVEFAYDDSHNKVILKDLNYDFEPNKLHAIVGESGVGKSTLIRLILALLTPQKGRVTLYDDSGEHTCSPMTRNNIIYVPQGNTITSGTIRENLLLANTQASEEEMRHALYVAAAEFVYDLPDGLDSLCGEGGAGLSEGQAQRIAIARSMLRNSAVVILDEPTAALDSQTEERLIERLREYAEHKTLIIVTHRPQSVAMCDTTLTLK